ncbi:MAG: type I-E CRISPR-associated protein Cas5/CasD [Chitinispirillaceae bacterium]|nr:type I-E CRISPR-associated protein Cas5/CasD [Chitinispirillaceae bacterium]
MSTETAVLALRLQGPMQSWGFNSQFNRRDTSLFPTKSALVGLCCAAMGINRGSEEEKVVLLVFIETKLICIAIPCKQKNMEVTVKRMQDYHTVQNTRDAKGSIKNDAVLTYRQYLNDAGFIALLEGEKEFLGRVAESLQNPVWGVWLGRKACIPSAPVFAGLFATEADALTKIPEIHGMSIERFSYTREVSSFGNGIDSYMDQTVSFNIHGRQFAPRRVMVQEAKV